MTKAQTPVPVTHIKLSPVKLGDDCKLLQHAHNIHSVILDGFTSISQLEDPSLWSFAAPTFKHMDQVQVTARDNSMIAFGLVVFAQGSIAKVHFYQQYDLEAVSQPEVKMQGFIIRQISATGGHEIVVEGTGDKLTELYIPTQAAAILYLQDHLKHPTKAA